MTDIMNPYIAGAPVTEARMFFGREDVFDWIEKSLGGKYADHILVVHGQRRVGKTSVLKQLGNRLPDTYIPVFFDLQGRTHTTLDHFLWWLARETARVLKQERGIEIPAPEKEDFAHDPEFFENTFLPGLQPVLGDTSLLFTFDEFDNLEESDVREELARPLTDYLRRLMGRGEINFIYSIGSSGRKLENMQAAYTEFFKTALYKKISFLSREQTHGLVTRPVEGVIEYDSAAVERIYNIASGHPYFTQLTCHELFARCQRTGQRSIALADVDAILDDVVERGTVNLKFVWDEASDIEKWSLAALAQMEKGENRLLADYLGRQRVRFSESDLTSALLHLREKDVLTPANGFVIHLLRLWLQKNRPIEQVREELTEANPIANRYIEIGQEFKDAGQFDKAIESFHDALNISANNLQAQVNIALAYAAQGQLEQAVIEFEKALAIDDEDVTSRAGMCDAHLALGDAAIKKGKTKEAVLSYQRVLAINAEHLEARQRMAELSRQRAEKALTSGRDEEALGAFSEALKFTPEDATLLARVEKVRAEKKNRVLNAQFARSDKEAGARNWEKAILALNEALEIAPGETSILERIEKVKEKQRRGQLEAILAKVEAAERGGRWDTAIAGLNEYLRVQPEDPAVQKRLADLLEARHAAWLSGVNARVDQSVKDREWDAALAALNEALQLEPGNAQMLKKLDQVQETRRKVELEDMLQRASQAVSGSRWDEAIDILNDGLVAYPDNETVKTNLAQARKEKRDARLQSVLRLADTAVQAGRWDTAAASLQEVLANEPDNTEFQDKLAQVKRLERESKLTTLRVQADGLLKAEKFEESLAAWEAHLALEPDDRAGAQAQIEAVKKAQNLSALYAEASGAYAKKNYEKAIELFKRIVVEDAEYRDTTDLLAESVRLRRTGHKTSKARLRKIWVTGGLVGFLLLALGGGLFWLGKNDWLVRSSRATGTASMTQYTESNTSEFVSTTSVISASSPTSETSAIQLAFDAIKVVAPSYQTSFDTWDFAELMEGARLEDGQLVITSTGGHVSASLDTPDSDMFAVQFDFSVTYDSGAGHCIFYNGGIEGFPYIATGYQNGLMEFNLQPAEDVGVLLAQGTYLTTISNTVIRIVLGDQVAEFLNGREKFEVSDPRLSNIYTESIFAVNYPITCAFDNFAYWDLSGLELSSPDASDEFASQPDWMTDFFTPIYESTHSRSNDYGSGGIMDYRDWLDTSCEYPQVNMNSEVYQLFLDCQFADWKYWLTDFLIEMEVRMEPLAEGDMDSDWTFHFRGWQGYRFSYSGEISALDMSIPDAYLNPGQYNHIVIIVKDQETALVVNGEPIFYGALDPGYESGVATFGGENVTFKYINIWDLNK